MTNRNLTGWTEGLLADYCDIKKGLTYSTSDYGDEQTGHPFITLKCIAKNGGFSYKGLKFLKPPAQEQFTLSYGDLLFANTDLTRDGDVVGSAMLLPKLSHSRFPIFSMDLSKVTPKNHSSDKRYLYYLFSTQEVKNHMVRCSAGSTVLHLNVNDAIRQKVRMPPITEQQKIAEILTSVDEVIENTQSQINKLEDLKKATMNELLTKGIGHTEFKETAIGRIPKSWKTCNLSEVCVLINGRAYSLTEWEKEGTPVIRLQNLTNHGGTFYYSNLALSEKNYCYKGDLLYMWSASFGPYIWWGDKAIFHYHIWKIEPNKSVITRDYLFYLLKQRTEAWKSKSSGMAMFHLTKEGMEKEIIQLPGLDEQRLVGKILGSVEEQLNAQQEKLSRLRNLRKSLMQDLLTGKVRVTVN